MGGYAFGTPAIRLSPLAYDHLCARVTAALAEVGTAVPPALPKDSHGDVDVLVSSSLSVLKGNKVGKPASAGCDLGAMESRGDVDGVCSELCRRISGTRWSRCGRVVSVAIPLASAPPAPPTDEFYQVDLILVPPRSLKWAQMSMAYGQAPQLLKTLCRAVAGSRISMQATYLGFVTPHQPRKPRREIELTTSPSQLCAWLGLKPYDPHDFDSSTAAVPAADKAETATAATEADIATMEPLFAWLGSAAPTSRAGGAYARLVALWECGTPPRHASKGAPMSKRQQRRVYDDDVAEAFCRWLAAHRKGDSSGAQSLEKSVDGDCTEWQTRCPELTDEEIRTLLFFGEMDAYLSTRM